MQPTEGRHLRTASTVAEFQDRFTFLKPDKTRLRDRLKGRLESPRGATPEVQRAGDAWRHLRPAPSDLTHSRAGSAAQLYFRCAMSHM